MLTFTEIQDLIKEAAKRGNKRRSEIANHLRDEYRSPYKGRIDARLKEEPMLYSEMSIPSAGYRRDGMRSKPKTGG